MAVRSNITEADHLFRGEDRALQILVVDEAGVPLNVSGYTLEWNLARNVEDAPLVSITSGIAVSDGNGTGDLVTVTVGADDTIGLLPGWYRHALWRTDLGSTYVLTFGKCYLGRAAG